MFIFKDTMHTRVYAFLVIESRYVIKFKKQSIIRKVSFCTSKVFYVIVVHKALIFFPVTC